MVFKHPGITLISYAELVPFDLIPACPSPSQLHAIMHTHTYTHARAHVHIYTSNI
jgi:hypothetical protein